MTGPRVTIGVPVYNGASMLEESLAKLRAQSFTSFEVIITDNASTDATPEIVARTCAADSRFRSVRQTENLGALGNFRFALWEARAPLFLWRSYDDLFDNRYIERLVTCLDQTPGAVLAAPHVETLRVGTGRRRPRPVARLQAGKPGPLIVLRACQAGWIYGLWRTDHLREIFDWAVAAIDPHVWGWDHLALFPAILKGGIAFENEARLLLRLNRAIAKEKRPDAKAQLRDLVARYRTACDALIDVQGLGGLARLRMRRAVRAHINRRIASIWKRM